MGKKEEKTNVMRILDEKGIDYEKYSPGEILDAQGLARALSAPESEVFKTLVTVAKSGEHYVFMLPADAELDLKKAAQAAGEKSVAMLAQKELLPLTGYVHGGCSPIGMKKQFETFIDESFAEHEKIYFSAGKIGRQVRMTPDSLIKAAGVKAARLKK